MAFGHHPSIHCAGALRHVPDAPLNSPKLPSIGRGRWIMEEIRPFIRQYFVESDTDGAPISRMFRSVVYQRAKGALETVPFGTQIDTYRTGYEWLGHSLSAIDVSDVDRDLRIMVGGPDCRQPYSASILNISAMSFGALSQNAILALNEGARSGGFAHNTGEGGISPYHLEHGGGSRSGRLVRVTLAAVTIMGNFSPERFGKESIT